MRLIILLLSVLVCNVLSAQLKYKTEPLKPGNNFKEAGNKIFDYKGFDGKTVDFLDSINNLFPTTSLPVFDKAYLMAGYTQFYNPTHPYYQDFKQLKSYRIPYSQTQVYSNSNKELKSKFEYVYLHDTIKNAWQREINTWPFFRRDSIFISPRYAVMFAHSPASYMIDTFKIYNKANLVFDSKGAYGAWDIPYFADSNKVIFTYTTAASQTFVAEVKIIENPKKLTKEDKKLGIAKKGKYTAVINRENVYGVDKAVVTLEDNVILIADSSICPKLQPNTYYYMVLGEPYKVNGVEKQVLNYYFAIPANGRQLAYPKSLRYQRPTPNTGRRGELPPGPIKNESPTPKN